MDTNAVTNLIHIHFIVGERIIKRVTCAHAPNVGDELRFSSSMLCSVKKKVWVLNEPDCQMQRLDVGLSVIDNIMTDD